MENLGTEVPSFSPSPRLSRSLKNDGDRRASPHRLVRVAGGWRTVNVRFGLSQRVALMRQPPDTRRPESAPSRCSAASPRALARAVHRLPGKTKPGAQAYRTVSHAEPLTHPALASI